MSDERPTPAAADDAVERPIDGATTTQAPTSGTGAKRKTAGSPNARRGGDRTKGETGGGRKRDAVGSKIAIREELAKRIDRLMAQTAVSSANSGTDEMEQQLAGLMELLERGRSGVGPEEVSKAQRVLGRARVRIGDRPMFRRWLQFIDDLVKATNREKPDASGAVSTTLQHMHASLQPDVVFDAHPSSDLIVAIIAGRADIPDSAAEWLHNYLKAIAAKPNVAGELRTAIEPLSEVLSSHVSICSALRNRLDSMDKSARSEFSIPQSWVKHIRPDESATTGASATARVASMDPPRTSVLPHSTPQTARPAEKLPIPARVDPAQIVAAPASRRETDPLVEIARLANNERKAIEDIRALADDLGSEAEPARRIHDWLARHRSDATATALAMRDILTEIGRILDASESQRRKDVEAESEQRELLRKKLAGQLDDEIAKLTREHKREIETINGDLERANVEIEQLRGRDETVIKPRVLAAIARGTISGLTNLSLYANHWCGDEDPARAGAADVIVQYLRSLESQGIVQIGKIGERCPFSPKCHQAGDANPADGSIVQIDTPGWAVRIGENRDMEVIERAFVTHCAEEVAE